MTMILYHRTTAAAAAEIIANGFRDSTGNYLTAHKYTGVWLSDQPLDVNEGAADGPLLKVSLDLSEDDIAPYEWIEQGKGYREWLIPAAVINPRMKIEIVIEDWE